MKIKLIALFGSLTFFIGCSNNTDDPGLDCSQSDLAVQVTDSVSPDCDIPGSITVSGQGGTAPYSFSIDGTNFQSSNIFEGLSAGSYSILVEDADGCSNQVAFELEPVDSGISLATEATNSECTSNTGTITVTASGGVGSFSYSLDGGTAQGSNVFNAVGAGTYEVVAIDEEGCSASREVLVSSNTSWMDDILPIINSKCATAGCHNGSLGTGRDWTVIGNVQSNAQSIKSRTASGSMPPAGEPDLTQIEIDLIACWVDDGANNN